MMVKILPDIMYQVGVNGGREMGNLSFKNFQNSIPENKMIYL